MNTLLIALYSLAPLVDPTPAKEDVKAGWGAFGIFIGLAIAVALLGWSLTRHLKKAKQNADEGAFGDVPAATAAEETEQAGSTPQA